MRVPAGREKKICCTATDFLNRADFLFTIRLLFGAKIKV